MRFFVVFAILLSSADVLAEDRKTSLIEATVYTGLPALEITSIVFANQLLNNGSTRNDLWDNFTWGFHNAPIWDDNPWYINYVCHPIAGSEYYLVARNRNYSIASSFLYSSIGSIAWEYMIESWVGARPSIQDLLITSTAGSVFGEVRFQTKKALKRYDSIFIDILIFILDPIDGLYGIAE